MKRYLCIGVLLSLASAGSMLHAVGPNDKPVSFSFDTGFSGVAGKPGDFINDGWTIGFAVYYKHPKQPFSWRFDVTYDWWDLDTGSFDLDPSTAVDDVLIDDGDVNQWSVRAGIHYESQGKVKVTMGAGIGGYREYANVTQTVIVPGYICDPYYWWYCYPGLVEGEAILKDKALTKFGYYGTIGVAWELHTSEFFLEAQYHWVNIENYYQTYPIVLGWRF